MTTPREQLARTLYVHTTTDQDAQAVRAKAWDASEAAHYFTADAYRLADAIIAAGWPPPSHPEEEEPFSRMSYEAMEAKLAQQESAPRIT